MNLNKVSEEEIGKETCSICKRLSQFKTGGLKIYKYAKTFRDLSSLIVGAMYYINLAIARNIAKMQILILVIVK